MTTAPAEYILCAAIYVDDGKAYPPRRSYSYPKTGLLFTGWRHCDCFVTMHAWSERLSDDERSLVGEEQLAGLHQGFMTSTGRFVDREEAYVIAIHAGQTKGKMTGSGSLYSEDLY